ncbi:DUF4232 domain-containing protein [Actinosynnema pretiosum]|uniref:Peptidase C14, caspase catalytic subunit P20 n=1 Tax=Actinosynnema pretiosum TaxID=42197 RepID=A0A290Z044_9PSEU|nr:DUF4232 domain-containing protein [Actinosynnema pretiosum]ATE52358.1 peptidase C14, caspase catalytic subunit P20 [Actinosynnema pretiosum]
MRRRLIAVCGVALAGVLAACGGGARPAAERGALTTEAAPSSAATGSSEPGASVEGAPNSADPGGGADPVPPSEPGGQPPGAGGRCTAASLTGRLQPTDAGAGNRHGVFVVTNTGDRTCTLTGYSGLQLLDAAGGPVPTDLVRTGLPAPEPVVVEPGASASADLRWTVVPTGDEPVEGPCEPQPASAAAIPPDETQPLTVTWPGGPVCGGGKIEISPFRAA